MAPLLSLSKSAFACGGRFQPDAMRDECYTAAIIFTAHSPK